MASETLNQYRTFTTGAVALAAYVRVKLDTGLLVVAGAGESAIGITIAPSAIGGLATVRLINGYGTAFMLAGAAIASGAPVYGIAAGKIDDAVAATNAGAPVGIALEAATADGDVIEVLLAGRISLPVEASANQAVVTQTSTNGVAAAAAADLAGLAAEAEKIGDDVRATIVLVHALRTALINSGIIKGAA